MHCLLMFIYTMYNHGIEINYETGESYEKLLLNE